MQLIFILTVFPCPCRQPQNSSSCLLSLFWFIPSPHALAEGLSWFLPFGSLHLRTEQFLGAKLRRTSSSFPLNSPILLSCPNADVSFPLPLISLPDACKQPWMLYKYLCLSLMRAAPAKSSMPWIMRAGSAAYISMFRNKQRVSSSGENFGAAFSASPAANHGLIFLLCYLTPFLQRLMHVSPWTSSNLEAGWGAMSEHLVGL